MSETRPTGEQLRFVSTNTGEHILDTYLEAAEKGGRTLADMLADIYDPTTGLFRTALFQFRITSDRKFQFRVGDFPDNVTGWTDVTANPSLFAAKGTWAATTAYAQTDIVTYNNSTYYCLTAHTSGATFSATNWAVMSDATALNAATSTASTSATAAAASASAASTSASTATTKATEASTSASNAATSASTAATQASTATTKATEANTSASQAATSASQAAASASTASTAATTATTKATEASNSASSASNSASTATTQATLATSKATDAVNAAAAAAADAATTLTRMVTAETKANAAAASAAAALASEQGANNSAATAVSKAAEIQATYDANGNLVASAQIAVTAANQAAQSALVASTYSVAAGLDTATKNAQAAASLAQGYAASAASVVTQDLSGITAQALHRSPNAITALHIYDTSKDSDGGAWTKRCQHTSWYNEALAGKWLGAADSELNARYSNATLGTELVSNGTFTTNTSGWTANSAATLSAVNGRLRITNVGTGAGGGASTAVTTVVGKSYCVSVDFVTDAATGNNFVTIGTNAFGSQLQDNNIGSAIGTKRFYFVATAATTYINIANSSTALNGEYAEFDNISVREVTAFNTASNDYFQLSTDGKFYRLWRNQLSYSDQFDNAAWTKSNTTVTANAIASPNGLATADLIIPDATNTVHSIYSSGVSLSASGIYVLSVYAKSSGYSWIRVMPTSVTAWGGTAQNAYFNVSAGTVGTVSGTGTASITSIGNGWYRCALILPVTTSAQSPGAQFNIVNADNGGAFLADGTSGVYLSGAQLELGSTATTYEAKAADGSTSEIFRGNKAEFPKLAGIVAEAGNVTIYDLTEAGRPMWMRFNAGGAGGGDAFLSGTTAYTKSSVAAINGELLIGQSTSGGFGLARVMFILDAAYAYSNSAIYGGAFRGDISQRNSAKGYPWPGASVPSIANSAVNAVAMTVLPNAPSDPRAGLRVPTIAVGTGGGVSVIKHDGTVVNSSSTSTFDTLTINPSFLSAGRADGIWYYAAGPGSLGASFTLSTRSASQAPGLNIGNTSKLVPADRNRLIRRSSTAARVQMARVHEADPSKALVATVGDTFNTGWTAGDVRRAYLSEILTTAATAAELVTNGDFNSGLTGWDQDFGNTQTVTSGALVASSTAGSNLLARQPIALVTGKSYKFSINVIAVNQSSALRIRVGQGGAITVVSNGGSYSNTTGIWTGVFTATTGQNYLEFTGGAAGATCTIDNVSITEAEPDRSYKAQSATVVGTITRAALATGTSLVGYSGFSASNYLREPFSADLDFGTGEFTASAWVNVPVTLPVTSFPAGSELLANTDFATDTVWDKGTGWTISAGTADKAAGVATVLGQHITFTAGKTYLLQFTVSNFSAGGVTPQFSGGTVVSGALRTANGTYSEFLVAQSGNTYFRFNAGATFVGSIDNVSLKEVGPAIIADRAFSSGPRIRLGVTGTGLLVGEAYDGTTTRTVTSTASYNTATWLKARVSYSTDGSLRLSVNGREVAATRGTPLLTLNNSSAVLTIGNSYALDAPFPGSIALLKLGATIPTPEQAQFMYEQEKQLFRAGAQSVLPDSTAIVDMAYDDATDRWVAISATNESYWTGLVRNAVTAVPAGSYTKVQTASGIELVARSTTNPGVDVTIPAYGLREELVRRAEAAARLTKELAIYDYVGGFTANTTNGSTAITSASTITYPGSYIGARISGTGIPANTTIVAVSGTTLYLSAAATATATGVSISFLDFALPAGMEAKAVLTAGSTKQEGSTKDYTRLYDGFVETIRFGTAPGVTAWVQIQAQRITLQ